MRVALVVMPFAAADRPSLAVGLLLAALKKRGIEADAKYFNVTLSSMLGHRAFERLSSLFTSTILAGEWVFAHQFWGDGVSDWDTYQREVLSHPHWGLAEQDHQDIRSLLKIAPLFLRAVFESNDWSRYDLVGFTSTFEQTMPSMCLARMIRQAHPTVLLAAGGANFESTMGIAHLEHFDFLDYVCTGEGDVAFPALCENLARGDNTVPAGIAHRNGNELEGTSPPRGSFVDMEALPVPDYDDYFRVVSLTSGRDEIVPWVPIEASRGCWWGEKAHCTFCGLNGDTMTFRRKSWQRVASEADHLEKRYGHRWLQFTDNILDMRYFDDLLPHWASTAGGSPKFFEVRSSLSRDQVRLLRRAGVVSVQAGIESFSSSSLQLMKKGVSALQNIALLRWCREAGVRAHWNILYGFPGENLGDYDGQLEIVRKITHLDPPEACAMIRLDRFSPNYMRWRELGFTSLAPVPAYRHVYPFDEDRLARIAYFFDFDHPSANDARWRAAPLSAFCTEWKEQPRSESATLAVKPHIDGGFVLVDTRFSHDRSALRLDECHLAWLQICNSPLSASLARKRMDEADPRRTSAHGQALAELLDRDAIIEIENRLLTLALMPEETRGS